MPNVQRADTLGRIDLVPRHAQQIDAEVVDIRFDLADRLGRVGVKGNFVLTRDRADLTNRLDRADFVVGVHDRDQHRLRRDGSANVIRIDPPQPVHRNVGYVRATGPLEKPARLNHRRVLDPGRDDVRTAGLMAQEHALDRVIIGFASATREHDFGRIASESLRHLPPRTLHRLSRRLAGPMPARRVSVMVRQVRAHRLGRLGRDRRTRIEVQVDSIRHRSVLRSPRAAW